MKRVLFLSACLSLLIIIAAGCQMVPPPTDSEPVAQSSPVEAINCPQHVDYSGFSDNEVEGVTYECGVVEVPEDYTNPDGRTLELVFLKLNSTSDTPADDPLLYLSGGPGGSAIHEMAPNASNFLLQNMQLIRAERDVIIYDQRGTGLSSPLLCGPVQAGIGAGMLLMPELADDIQTMEESEEDYGQTIFNAAVCAGLYEKVGVDLAQYNSVASAHDMAALMDALGYDQYNLYGTSYGTKLAQVALRETPDRIRTIITDGTTPITGAVAATSGIEGQELYVNLFEQCAADPACAEAYPDLPERFSALLDRLLAEPVPLDEPIVPSGIVAAQFPGMSFDAIDIALFQTLNSIDNTMPYKEYTAAGFDLITDKVPAIIAAAEANDIDTLRAIFESPPPFPIAQGEQVAMEFPDEGSMLPQNDYVAPTIQTLLTEAQKAAVVTRADTPQKKWVASVIHTLAERLGEDDVQTDVIGELIEFALLPSQGRDPQNLIDYANENMPEEIAAQMNGLVERMTSRDIRAVLWHINEIAADMSFVGEEVTGMHDLVLFAVNCPESVAFHTQADVDAAVAAAEFPQLDEFTENSWPLFAAGCGFFPQPNYIDASFLDPIDSETPALIINGGMDKQTPLSGAEEVADYLTNSQLVIFDSEGHVVASKTGSCPGSIAVQFLDEPMGAVDATCAEEFVIHFVVPE